MPAVLDATPAGASANSYVSREGAQAYFDTRMNVGPWTAADAAAKDLALMAATARLEQERFVGHRVGDVQALSWPRSCASDPEGGYYDEASVPAPVQRACAELALAMLAAGSTDTLAPSGLEQFEALSVGPVSLTPNLSTVPGALPPMVLRWLRGLLTSQPGVTRLVRG